MAVGSVKSQAHVVFSVHLSLSVKCLKSRAQLPNGVAGVVFTIVMFAFGPPSKFCEYAMPPVTTMSSMTIAASRRNACPPSSGDTAPSAMKRDVGLVNARAEVRQHERGDGHAGVQIAVVGVDLFAERRRHTGRIDVVVHPRFGETE